MAVMSMTRQYWSSVHAGPIFTVLLCLHACSPARVPLRCSFLFSSTSRLPLGTVMRSHGRHLNSSISCFVLQILGMHSAIAFGFVLSHAGVLGSAAQIAADKPFMYSLQDAEVLSNGSGGGGRDEKRRRTERKPPPPPSSSGAMIPSYLRARFSDRGSSLRDQPSSRRALPLEDGILASLPAAPSPLKPKASKSAGKAVKIKEIVDEASEKAELLAGDSTSVRASECWRVESFAAKQHSHENLLRIPRTPIHLMQSDNWV